VPPSIVPNDRLDRDFYIVLEDFQNGAAVAPDSTIRIELGRAAPE